MEKKKYCVATADGEGYEIVKEKPETPVDMKLCKTEDRSLDKKPYCIPKENGKFKKKMLSEPPTEKYYEIGDEVDGKVLSDECVIEGGGEVTGDPHFVMWSGQKYDVR